ncbi:hypothetical protein PSJE_12490 [Pseudomonas jessenii]|nr:hypothetical protein PSJE_12490 [Pseudomonas jessenii]
MDLHQSARNWPAVRSPSRASPLPHFELCTVRKIRPAGRPPRLLLICPPPREAEWRHSSGDWRAAPFDAVELIACRSKRSRPEGNAPG